MSNCPCCSNPMLRHIRGHQIYWFCRHCWAEMPNLESKKENLVNNRLRSIACGTRRYSRQLN